MRETKPEGAVLFGEGPADILYEDIHFDFYCHERILYMEDNNLIFGLSVVHNPTEEVLSEMQALNELANEGKIGAIAVYDNDSPLMVWTRMDKAYEVLQNYQGVPIPLNDPEHIQVSALNDLLLSLKESKDQFEQDARFLLSIKLYELEKISSGKAAKLAGLGRVQFLLKMGQYRVSPFQVSMDEILEEASR